jgi:hypothetical protein
MSTRRARSITAKVTEEEYVRLTDRAGAQKISTWARERLLDALEPSSDHAVLAELVAVRTILVNVLFTIANGQRLTADQMRALIDRADHEKRNKAIERLATMATGGAA